MIQVENFQTSYPLVPLEELLENYIGGDWGIAPESNDAEYVNVKCIRATELRNWAIEKAKTAVPRKIKKASLVKRNLLEGDIILEISGGGPEQPVGRVEVITKEVINFNHGANLVCTNFFRMLRPNNQVTPKFLKLYLDFFYLCGPIQELQSGSNNLRNLQFNDYLKILVPLPDIEQQDRIIQSIEISNGQIESGVESLRLIEKQLELYRQSVLKEAFEGKLTADWREANPDLVEPADKLLAHIEAERKAAHQAELDAWADTVKEWEACGKDGKKPSKPKFFLFDEEVIVSSPTVLCLNLGRVILEPKYGTSKKCSYESGQVPVLRIPNLAQGKIDSQDLKYADFTKDELNNYKLENGDLLIIRSNGSVSLVGKTCIITEQEEGYLFAGYLIRLKPIRSIINSQYLMYILGSLALRKQIVEKAKSTSGVNNLNAKEIQNLTINLVSLNEQQRLVDILNENEVQYYKQLSLMSELKKKAEALKKSILKQAFSGYKLLEDVS